MAKYPCPDCQEVQKFKGAPIEPPCCDGCAKLKAYFEYVRQAPCPLCGAGRGKNDKKRDQQLCYIANIIQTWLEWGENNNKSDDAHIMRVPIWPTREQLKNWIAVLRGEDGNGE